MAFGDTVISFGVPVWKGCSIEVAIGKSIQNQVKVNDFEWLSLGLVDGCDNSHWEFWKWV